MKKLLLITVLFLTFSSPSYPQSFEWIKNQNEYSDANGLFWDKEKRFLKLIKDNIYADKNFPSFTGTEGTLFITIERLLGGPPTGIKYYDNRRYVTTSACEAHACPEKAFVFIDTKEKYVIGLIRKWDGEYYIISKTHKTFNDLPDMFAQAVNDWESEVDVKPTEIFFIGTDAELIKIK